MIEFNSQRHSCTHIPPKYECATPNESTGCLMILQPIDNTFDIPCASQNSTSLYMTL